jgi:hypothetical protein
MHAKSHLLGLRSHRFLYKCARRPRSLYTALSAAEADPLRKDLFLQLAQAESGHAQLWRDKLAAAGVQDERFVPGFRTRLLAKLAQRFGPGFVLPTIAATEFADRNKYAGQSDAHAVSAEERGHAAVIQAVAANSGRGKVCGPIGPMPLGSSLEASGGAMLCTRARPTGKPSSRAKPWCCDRAGELNKMQMR